MADYDQIPEQALIWHEAGKNVALATVVNTWGSAPRPVGAQMVISGDMDIAGSVSGGCVEGAVIEEALATLHDGQPRIIKYGVSDEDAFAVGMACGGEIDILVEPVDIGKGIPAATLRELVGRRAARKPTAYLVNTATWQRRIAGPDFDPHSLSDRFFNDNSGFDGKWFINIHNPPLRLIVVGAVHIAQPLLQMAALAGYDTTLIDPRDAFASKSRFPGKHIILDWPDTALKNQQLDSRVAVVTLTHDPKLDDPAIKVALASDIFYLGCLGSKRTHNKRVTRLHDAGFSTAEINQIHAPVGADIGAKTPAEIAVAIMAEITERLRRPETRPKKPDIPTGNTEIILLAAGASKRMQGTDKLMEQVHAMPLLRHCATTALGSLAKKVHVIVQPGNTMRSDALSDLDLNIINSPDWQEGMAASIRAGMAALSADCDAVIIALADMPDISTDHFDRVIKAFNPKKHTEICRAVTADGRAGLPVLFGRNYFNALSALQGDRGARDILKNAPTFVIDVKTSGQGAVIDLDTAEDWVDWRNANHPV